MLKTALNDSSKLINYFTLKSSIDTNNDAAISCQRINIRENSKFLFTLSTDKEAIGEIKTRCLLDTYDIRFHENRLTYLVQHNALQYIKEHNLVDCFLNNKAYGKDLPENVINLESYYFR